MTTTTDERDLLAPAGVAIPERRRGTLKHESDIRWFWNEGFESHQGSMGEGGGGGKSAPDFEPSEQVLRAVGRYNRIMQILALVDQGSVRVLQRRYTEHSPRAAPFPKLSSLFGLLAGVVDYLGNGEDWDARSLEARPTAAQISRVKKAAEKAVQVALVAYHDAAEKYWGEFEDTKLRMRLQRTMGPGR